jgi:hypothetical protein
MLHELVLPNIGGCPVGGSWTIRVKKTQKKEDLAPG